MKNIGGRTAGSITAAQFLQRFVGKKTPWAHLDIAGTGMKNSRHDPRETTFGTGFGVRRWRALVKLPQDKLSEMDDHLWTFRDDSFLPHGRDTEPMGDWQPILLSSDLESAKGFDAVFLLGGMDVREAEEASRVMVMINGRSEADVTSERRRWKKLKETGASLSYYQQNSQGRWEKKA